MALPSIAPYPLPTAAELPPARVAWAIDAARAALLIHDMQRYFMSAFRADADPIATVIANIARLRAACDAAGMPVFYTAQPVRQDPKERGLQADFWGPGMQLDPEHRAIVDALAPQATDTVLTKWRYSAFQRSDFGERLAAAGRTQLIVTGVFGHIGCLATTFDAFVRDIQPFFVADAVGDFSRAKHDMAIGVAAGCCARVLTAADAVGQIERVKWSGGASASAEAMADHRSVARRWSAPPGRKGIEGLALKPALTIDQMRADIARVLQADEHEMANTDNLIDHGLDSIRLMTLTERWRAAGAPITFEQLAEYPEINHWWTLISGGR